MIWCTRAGESPTGGLGRAGTNGWRYLEFMRECGEQSLAAGGDAVTAGGNILKALDECNYGAFSKEWIQP